MNIFSKILFSIFFLFFYTTSLSFAVSEFTYKMLPSFPKAHETIELNLKSNYFDLDNSEISYYIDGTLIKQAFGLKNFLLKTRGVGEETKIKIEIKKYNGEKVTEVISIIPAEVALTYEVEKPYRPFRYQGGSVALSDSKLKVRAFANFQDSKGNRHDTKKLIYNWYKNYELEYQKSGTGKNIYNIERLPANPRQTVISVKVYSQDRKLVAKDSLTFSPERSTVDFYLESNTLPFSFKNIANPNIVSNQLDSKIIAVPYFMNNIPDDVYIEWRLNDNFINPLSKNPLAVLLSNSLEKFSQRVNLFIRVKNKRRILQSVEKKIKVIFPTENFNFNKKEETQFFKKRENKFEEKEGLFGWF